MVAGSPTGRQPHGTELRPWLIVLHAEHKVPGTEGFRYTDVEREGSPRVCGAYGFANSDQSDHWTTWNLTVD
jgi:hypothetical protein